MVKGLHSWNINDKLHEKEYVDERMFIGFFILYERINDDK